MQPIELDSDRWETVITKRFAILDELRRASGHSDLVQELERSLD